ncbi:fungal zn(2)-Cys(6) binuclear cluster domain-containing protein [Apiospora marii]|uniref:Fungal zn(2)-Cys(6) binuclear cluster domain-containing protein n=1 Tax=Apiospora marii TaxID=335849 RepID=A0ABR1SS16_9PEZI
MQFHGEADRGNNDNSLGDAPGVLGFAIQPESNYHYAGLMQGNNASSSTISRIDTPQTGDTGDEACALILNQLSSFSSAIFCGQSQIAGIIDVVVKYLAWLRNVPPGIAPLDTSQVQCKMLENIENRLRELREMAETGHNDAFRLMVAAIRNVESDSINVTLDDLEGNLQKQSSDLSDFFRTRYNVSTALSEQLQATPYGRRDGSVPRGFRETVSATSYPR